MNAPPNQRSPKWTRGWSPFALPLAPLNERSPKRALPQTSAPPNEHKKIALENGRFRTQNVNKIDQKKNCD